MRLDFSNACIDLWNVCEAARRLQVRPEIEPVRTGSASLGQVEIEPIIRCASSLASVSGQFKVEAATDIIIGVCGEEKTFQTVSVTDGVPPSLPVSRAMPWTDVIDSRGCGDPAGGDIAGITPQMTARLSVDSGSLESIYSITGVLVSIPMTMRRR